MLTAAPGHAEQAPHPLRVGEQFSCVACVHDAALVEHDRVLARRAARRRGSARRAAPSSARRRARARRATSVTSSGASPFVGSSTSSTRFSFSSARAIASICCWPPESVPARWRRALAQLGEELVDELVARLAVALGEPEVLRRRSAPRRRRGPRARSRRRAARSCASAGASISLAAELDARRVAGTRPSSARSVVVLPTPFRPSSAVTPPSATSNETPCRTCDSAEVHVHGRARGSSRARRDRAHSASPR